MTLIQTIESLRSRGILSLNETISIKKLNQRFQPSPFGSVRALILKMLDSISQHKPWAVILCRFKNDRPRPDVEKKAEEFFRQIFTPGSGGLVEYWRDVSLGNIDITGSQVFGWVEVEIPRSKAGGTPETIPAGPGRVGLADFAIKATGKNLDKFHAILAVYLYNWSVDGMTQTGDWKTGWGPSWIDGSADRVSADPGTKVTLTPNFDGDITAHEMGHGFGMNHDVDSDLQTDYRDPCCIMSQNGSFVHPRWQVNFGPAICLPHLLQRNWMYNHRVISDDGGWMAQREGITLPLAPISCPGARANLGIKLAYTRGTAFWDYYLEYVIATEWNRGVPGAPYLFIRRMSPKYGGTPAYLGAIPIPAAKGIPVEWTELSGNVKFRVELTDLPGPIIKVNAKKL